jgi:hypothetical protein
MDPPAGGSLPGQPRKFREGLVDDLIAYAEHAFTLGKRTGDGATEGEHRVSAAAQWEKLGRKVKAGSIAKAPAFPEALRYLWHFFAEILNGCASSGWGPREITWRDLAAWSAMTGNSLKLWECRALMALSAVFVRVNQPKKPAQKQ